MSPACSSMKHEPHLLSTTKHTHTHTHTHTYHLHSLHSVFMLLLPSKVFGGLTELTGYPWLEHWIVCHISQVWSPWMQLARTFWDRQEREAYAQTRKKQIIDFSLHLGHYGVVSELQWEVVYWKTINYLNLCRISGLLLAPGQCSLSLWGADSCWVSWHGPPPLTLYALTGACGVC